jgi:hypothetical protein
MPSPTTAARADRRNGSRVHLQRDGNHNFTTAPFPRGPMPVGVVPFSRPYTPSRQHHFCAAIFFGETGDRRNVFCILTALAYLSRHASREPLTCGVCLSCVCTFALTLKVCYHASLLCVAVSTHAQGGGADGACRTSLASGLRAIRNRLPTSTSTCANF